MQHTAVRFIMLAWKVVLTELMNCCSGRPASPKGKSAKSPVKSAYICLRSICYFQFALFVVVVVVAFVMFYL